MDVKNLSYITRLINQMARDRNLMLCYTDHCKQQMKDRNITSYDVLFVLKTGRVESYQGKGEYKEDKNIHRYKMVGLYAGDDSGREIGVVLLIEVDRLSEPAIKIQVIVTAMWQDRR